MGTLPRRIDKKDIKGYVFCPKIGLLPCEDKEDKDRLMHFAEVVSWSVYKKRTFVNNMGILQTELKAPMEERDALGALSAHLLKNIDSSFNRGNWKNYFANKTMPVFLRKDELKLINRRD
ncbi:MAG: hypothetical protein AB1668_05550 [Nanoarchaeota archaeon]